MGPQKKGFCLEFEFNHEIRFVGVRFMEFCEDYREYFTVYRQNASEPARNYLAGLLMKAPRKNMERLVEYVEGSEYESVQQFITSSPWDHKALNKRVSLDVNALIGGPESVFCIDESGFTKKGKDSVGVKRQYNGRLGKVDNCQVGVFASLCNGKRSSIVNNRLFLPENWVDDSARCDKAKIPLEERVFKTKPELAQDMVDASIADGLSFGWVAMDALYGRDSKFINYLVNKKILYVADVPCDQTIYLRDPKPYMPRRRNKMGPKFKHLRSREEGIRADALYKQIDVSKWNKVEVRDTTKGKLYVHAYRKRIFTWDGKEKNARECWLVIMRDYAQNEIKYFLSNAPKSATLKKLVQKHACRYWIERSFQDGKTSVGMADYQVRRWKGWQHHMSMVMLAMLFLLKERILNEKGVEMLSCQDIVDLLNHYLPRKDVSEEMVFKNMFERHEKRKKSIESAYRRQKLSEAKIPK